MRPDKSKISQAKGPYGPENNYGPVNDNAVYVFGSNPSGTHGGGAKYCFANGLINWGSDAIGISKSSHAYGINTMADIDKPGIYTHGTKSQVLSHIQEQTRTFIEYAKSHPNKKFIILPFGVSIAGHNPIDVVAPFKEQPIPSNIKMPLIFKKALGLLEEVEENMNDKIISKINAIEKEIKNKFDELKELILKK